MTTMPASQWNALPANRKYTIDGQPHLLRLDPTSGATVLAPVSLTPDRLGAIPLGTATYR